MENNTCLEKQPLCEEMLEKPTGVRQTICLPVSYTC